MAKVFIGVGHGGTDPGAVGVVIEKVANLEMALACKDYLIKNGVEVKISRDGDTDDSLQSRINKCNAFNPDFALDIHNNAGGGDGFEVYYHYKGGKSLELAKNLEEAVKNLGQNSRGCKTRLNTQGTDYFGFIRETKAPAVIVEGFFVDNKVDATIADTIDEQRAFGIAYAKGILKTLGITPKQDVWYGPISTQKLYRVQVGAFVEKDNAEKMATELKNKGYNSTFIVEN